MMHIVLECSKLVCIMLSRSLSKSFIKFIKQVGGLPLTMQNNVLSWASWENHFMVVNLYVSRQVQLTLIKLV